VQHIATGQIILSVDEKKKENTHSRIWYLGVQGNICGRHFADSEIWACGNYYYIGLYGTYYEAIYK
jgi:hypothetical protein